MTLSRDALRLCAHRNGERADLGIARRRFFVEPVIGIDNTVTARTGLTERRTSHA